MTDKAKLEKQIEEMEAKLQEMREELNHKKQWEPEGGTFTIMSDGNLSAIVPSMPNHRNFGTERKTKEQAEKARDKMRVFNRLLSYVDEHAPDYEPDWDDIEPEKYCIAYNYLHEKWEKIANNYLQTIGAVYMPRTVAENLCRKLNSGEVVL